MSQGLYKRSYGRIIQLYNYTTIGCFGIIFKNLAVLVTLDDLGYNVIKISAY